MALGMTRSRCRALRLGPALLFAVVLGVVPVHVSGVDAQPQPGTTGVGAEQAQAAREVKVAVTVIDPYVIKRPDGSYAGFSIDIWQEIARRNGYTTVYVEKPDVEAQISAVRAGEADAAIGAIQVTAERARAVDFTEPTSTTGLQMMVASGTSPALT